MRDKTIIAISTPLYLWHYRTNKNFKYGEDNHQIKIKYHIDTI